MRKDTNELFFQLVALMLAIIMVHAVYVTVVRPNADTIINRAAEVAAAGGDYVVPRSFFVVIKDFEQEACFVLMLWALAIMGYKTRSAMRESSMLEMPLISVSEGTRILPGDAGQLVRPLQSLPERQQRCLLPRALSTALLRFQVTASVEAATEAAHSVCEAESNRLDSELSMVRYITWAIPSIGFIGTAGDPLLMEYNGGSAEVLIDDVQQFDLSYLTRTLTASGYGGGSPGTVTFHELGEGTRTGNGTNVFVATPSGTGAGDLLIAAVATDDNTSGSLAAPPGWTEITISPPVAVTAGQTSQSPAWVPSVLGSTTRCPRRSCPRRSRSWSRH